MSDITPTLVLVQETKEFIPLTVTADGVAVTTFDVSVCAGTDRPTVWIAASAIAAQKGVLVGVGTSWPITLNKKYTVYVRFTDSPEIPVVRAAFIKTT